MVAQAAVNNFKVGDIIEACFDPKEQFGPAEWVRYSRVRDLEDAEWAKEVVATDGGSLGIYSALLAHEGAYPWKFRTVTP